jgi:hypothetical protein
MQLVKDARQVGGGQLTLAVQRALVEHALSCDELRAAPMAITYQRRVLQALVQAAEEDGCEPADPLVELFTRAQLVCVPLVTADCTEDVILGSCRIPTCKYLRRTDEPMGSRHGKCMQRLLPQRGPHLIALKMLLRMPV